MESAQKADCGPLVIETIYANFRRGLGEREEKIRQNIDKIVAVSKPAENSVWPRSSSESAARLNGSTASPSKSESEGMNQIGRASCRERVEISVGAVSLHKNT